MLPGNMYLAEELPFLFRGLTQFVHLYSCTQKYKVTELGFLYNILLIEILLKSKKKIT